MAAARKTKLVVDVEQAVRRARAALAESGVMKITALGPKSSRASVVDALVALGFEATKSAIRRPLAAQLADALSHGAFIPCKSIGSFVRGGTAAEMKAALARLIDEGTAILVLRESAEVLVPSRTAVLSRGELLEARRVHDRMSKAVAKALKTRACTMLRADAIEPLQQLLHELRLPASNHQGNATGAQAGVASTRSPVTAFVPQPDIAARVLAAVDAARDERLGLAFIPRIFDLLRPEFDDAAVRVALIDAAMGGLIELRPEGGMNRLSQHELDLCLPGPQGARLSWVRRREGARS